MEDHCDKLDEEEDCLCNTLDEKEAHLSNLEEDFLFELMLAANFLHVPGLLDALAKVFFSTYIFKRCCQGGGGETGGQNGGADKTGVWY